MGKGKGILIVQDEALLALVYENFIHSLGHSVLAKVDSGQAAIEAALSHKPDVILMDIYLKGEMDGIEAAKEIQKSYNIPVIYITGDTEDNLRNRAEETNYISFLTKPILMSDLEAAIRQL